MVTVRIKGIASKQPDPTDGESGDVLRISRPRATLREQVLDKLRHAILTQRLHPGERLIERELCERTGVSRTSVREALRHLETEGLVRNVPYKGPVVATLSADKAREIYEVRAVLEGLAGELCAQRASDSVLERLARITDELETHLGSDNLQLALETTAVFYGVIFEGCQNEELRVLVRSMQARITSLRAISLAHKGRARKSAAELRSIMLAIKARDPDEARRACIEHVRNAQAAAQLTLNRLAAEESASA